MIAEIAWIVFYAFSVAMVYLILAIAIQKYTNKRSSKKHGLARDYIFSKYFDYEEVLKPVTNRFFFDAFIDVETQVLIDPEVRSRIVLDIMETRHCKKQYKRLHARSIIKRKTAAFYLSALEHEDAIKALKHRLMIEKDENVRFYIVYALKNYLDQEIVTAILNSIASSTVLFRKKIYTILSNNFAQVKPYLLQYGDVFTPEIMHFMLYLAKHHTDPLLKDYALNVFQSFPNDFEAQKMALEALVITHPEAIAKDTFFNHPNREIKGFAIKASANIISEEMVDYLLKSMDGSELDRQGVGALSRITYESKNILLYVLDSYPKYRHEPFIREAIVRVLSHRIDYLMLKLNDPSYSFVAQIIEDLLKLHIAEDFIDFMNRNKDSKIEEKMLTIIKKTMIADTKMMEEFSIYLKQDILIKMGMIKKTPPIAPREKAPIEKYKITFVIKHVLLGLMVMPLLFVITT
jgi:hypothetical protein